MIDVGMIVIASLFGIACAMVFLWMLSILLDDRRARSMAKHHIEMIGFYRKLVSSGVDPEREGLFRRHIEEHQAELRRLT